MAKGSLRATRQPWGATREGKWTRFSVLPCPPAQWGPSGLPESVSPLYQGGGGRDGDTSNDTSPPPPPLPGWGGGPPLAPRPANSREIPPDQRPVLARFPAWLWAAAAAPCGRSGRPGRGRCGAVAATSGPRTSRCGGSRRAATRTLRQTRRRRLLHPPRCRRRFTRRRLNSARRKKRP